MDEGKANEAIRILGNNPGGVDVCLLVVTMKRRKDDRLVNACGFCPSQIGGDRRVGISWPSEQVAFSSVAVAVNDHDRYSL